MLTIADASTVINLANGGVLWLPKATGRDLQIGRLVEAECSRQMEAIEAAIRDGAVSRLDDALVPAATFLSLSLKHGLGAGETECIAAAVALGCAVAIDDGRARSLARDTVGEGRLTGTIGFLKTAVQRGIVSVEAAMAAYESMVRAGGFLPRLRPSDLTS